MQRDNVLLVAGAGGFIGGHLVARLTAHGATVRAVDIKPLSEWYQLHESAENIVADLTSNDACLAVTEGVEVVFQLAADMGGMGYIERNKARCMMSVLATTHLLRAATQARVARFFFASSACVYNTQKQELALGAPLREEDAYPAMPEDGYGWEKLFSERMCRHFREDFGLETRVARFHNVYGPNGAWDGGREKAPAAVCRKVIEAIASGTNTIDIWGPGTQTRSFMYIDDCIQGMRLVTESAVADPINVGSNELVTINQLVDIVEAIAGVRLERTYDLSAPLGVIGRNSDNTMIRERLGWEPTIALRDGLESTYRWIYDQFVARYGKPR